VWRRDEWGCVAACAAPCIDVHAVCVSASASSRALRFRSAGALAVHTALAETPAHCEETYGIFPCSTSLPGTLLLIAGYGYMLLQGANLISDGSELLLAVMDPGLIGGLLLPILGALPDAAMIVVSGTGGSVAEAQEDVAVGIGTLAGSTVMLLSIAWGGSLVLGRCDIENERAVNKKLTKGWHPTETGVTSDKGTRINAYIMVASAFLYLFPQTPTFLGHPHSPTASLAGAIACLVALVLYCIYQVVYPELQKREKEAAHQKFVRQSSFKMAAMMARHAGAVLMDDQGNVREEALRALFKKFDEDGSGTIDGDELRKMARVILGADGEIEPKNLEQDMQYLMKELDKDGDGNITYEEMRVGLTRWIKEQKAEQVYIFVH
jgi:Ca2+/Na+ antiporter